MPSATPTHVLERLLDPGRAGADDRLSSIRRSPRGPGLRGSPSPLCKSTSSNTGLGKRSQGLARAAAIAAATTGLVTEAAREDEPFGFCLASGGPGELVCIDSFYIGKLKGVGKVYQLSAIDVFTRLAFVWLGPRAPPTPPSRCASWTVCSATTAATGSRSEPCSATTVPSTTPRPSAWRWRPKD